MDYVLKNRLISGTSEILDTISQQPVDLDFTLPDYCADIEKILKCSLTPKIYTRSFSAGQLRVDGASVVRIIYCDSNKKALRCCEQTLPFSATFPVSAEAGEHIILTSAKPEYLNCRALTPRRLTVHGAFSLYASIVGKSVYDIYEDNMASDLQTKVENAEICELCEFSQEQFSVSEAVSLRSKSPVESIVRSDVSAVVTDAKPAGDKMMLKGEITLRMLYICDSATGETDQFVYVFPFTQMLDGADPDCTVSDVRLNVLSYELLLRSEMVSEEPVVNLEAKLCASLMGYKPQTVSFISDAYSVSNMTELTFETVPMCTDILPVSSTTAVKSTLSLGERNIQKIVDIFSEDCAVNAEVKDSVLNFSGKVNVCIIACTEDGELCSVERQVDISFEEMLQKNYPKVRNVSAAVNSISYRLGDNNEIELRLDLRLCAVLSDWQTVRQVTSVTSAGESVSASDEHALTLYYAHSGEQVWDIAKHYGASMSSICDENSLTEDVLSTPRMLLILRV